MQPLTRFLEEVRLGVVENPHTKRKTILTEMVTVCPSCHGLHTLRAQEKNIRCVECGWDSSAHETAGIG